MLQKVTLRKKSIFDVFPELSKEMKTQLLFALDGLKDIQMLNKVSLPNGTTKKVVWHVNAWKNTTGDTVGVVLTAEDVTREKELEYDLLKAKNLLAEKEDITKIGSWEYDVDTQQLLLSDGTKKIFKIETSAHSINDLEKYCAKKSTVKVIKNLVYEAIKNGAPWDENLVMRFGTNQTVTINTLGRPKYKDGYCKRIVGTIQIVENDTPKIVKNTGTDTVYFDQAPVAMVLLDFATGIVIKANEELEKLAKYGTYDEGLQRYYNLFKKEHGSKSKTNDELETNYILHDNILIHHKNETNTCCTVKGKLIHNNTQLLCTLQESSNQDNYINELESKAIKAEQHAENLMNFTHIISHNLKGHAINYGLISDLLAQEQNEKERLKLFAVLRHSTQNLTDTVTDLRDMVSIENGIKTEKQRITLNDYVFKAQKNLAVELKTTNAKLLNEIPDSQKITAHPVYLENILTNCISNAVKFRKIYKYPVISISTTIEKHFTIIHIEDNGIGMNLNVKGDKLFKIATSLSNNEDSRGMGLYLVKHQIELMNGKIEVESEPNKGTLVKLFFPHS